MISISIKELLTYILLGCGIIAVVELIVLIRKLFPLLDPLLRTLEDVSVIAKEAKEGTVQVKNAISSAAGTTQDVLGAVRKNGSKINAATNLINATALLPDSLEKRNKKDLTVFYRLTTMSHDSKYCKHAIWR